MQKHVRFKFRPTDNRGPMCTRPTRAKAALARSNSVLSRRGMSVYTAPSAAPSGEMPCTKCKFSTDAGWTPRTSRSWITAPHRRAWPLALATGAGLATALFWHFAIDPWLRIKAPADYPTTMEQWLAMTLFSLGLKQLFVVFAPFACLIRLFGRKEPAFILTVVFGIAVVVIRAYRSPSSMLADPFFPGLLQGHSPRQLCLLGRSPTETGSLCGLL